MNPEAPFSTNKIRVYPDRAFRKALLNDRLVEDDRRHIGEYIAEYQALRHIAFSGSSTSRSPGDGPSTGRSE